MRLVSLVVLFCGGLVLSACGSAAPVKPMPAPKASASKPKASPKPAWVEGELPTERAFYGVAFAPVQADEAQAKEAATQKATGALQQEFAIMISLVKHDHSEQVAEIITRYPTADFDAHVDASATDALGKAEVMDTWLDRSRDPARQYVLVSLSAEAFYTLLEARPDLPEEQKKRVRDHKNTFVDNVMVNLAR